jgi:superfamily II DNA/RNA helicase
LEAKDKKRNRFNQYPIKEEVLNLLHENNFRKPTLVQAESLPITLQENLRDLCIIIYAYNGAGKTLSYIIPILNSL